MGDLILCQSHERKMITGAQVRAARGLIRWSAETLAERARLGVATVRRAEASDGPLSLTAANAAALQSALETAGVVFVAENGDGAGVRLRKPQGPVVEPLGNE